ncbi:glycoside hydrolase family 3 N-terminal domain-containing protein [Pseudomonas sp. LFM046]|uniref:glycoside hydrolase family 3 N-terminal domain-containing protein n=1 Tax=Pseudomonas sp. LFM046 TaxID=1608357 RepID=UPI0005CFB4FB|nr:glycoside hydrolase family 3 N-terminal domain-containing protein [Pseudomonas sp. LFM046]
MSQLLENAYAVLLPAFATLELDQTVMEFLEKGGASILLGESRGEYLARTMTDERRARETEADFHDIIQRAHRHARGNLLVAVDQELGGIQRLHDLVTPLPSAADARQWSDADIVARSREVARAARKLGINLFLAPIVDVVTGANPWLSGRHLGTQASEVSRISCAFIEGVQATGVAAAAKHFPGHPVCELDPAEHEAIVGGSNSALQLSLGVFSDVIEHGVKAIMAGPALVPSVDAEEPSSTSRTTLALLREQMGFTGLIISDDLDAPGIQRGRSIESVAVASISAGADLLLLSSESGLDEVARALVSAVENGTLAEGRLAEAAARVRTLASEFGDACSLE